MLNRKVTKAVITAAGYGTRFLPATKNVPKEMLPIIDTPILQYIVEEAVASGIKDIIIVTKYGNDAVENHFDSLLDLESFLGRVDKKEKLEEIRNISKMANIAFVRQRRDLPYGNAAPLLSAKPFLDDDNFCYAWGDDLTIPKSNTNPVFKQIIDKFENSDAEAVIAVHEISREEVNRYGIASFKEGTTDVLDRVIEKPNIEEAPTNLVSFGRYICSPKIWDYLGAEYVGKGNEIWFSEGIDRLAQDFKVLVHKIEGAWYTTGDPLNFLKATMEFAIRRDDLKGPLLAYLDDFVKLEKKNLKIPLKGA